MLTIIAICIGASTGALARWQLGLWLNPVTISPSNPLSMPWGTLAANLIGGYLVGVCVAVFQAMPSRPLHICFADSCFAFVWIFDFNDYGYQVSRVCYKLALKMS
jgi:fluoride ion exporter CrcB/FEX